MSDRDRGRTESRVARLALGDSDKGYFLFEQSERLSAHNAGKLRRTVGAAPSCVRARHATRSEGRGRLWIDHLLPVDQSMNLNAVATRPYIGDIGSHPIVDTERTRFPYPDSRSHAEFGVRRGSDGQNHELAADLLPGGCPNHGYSSTLSNGQADQALEPHDDAVILKQSPHLSR